MDIKKQVANIQKSSLLDPRFKKYDEDTEITDNALDGVNRLFNSILPHFPAWRQSCPTDDDLSRLKLVWTKALLRNKQKTGNSINLKAGIAACEESDSDWLPSVGKFIKWCEQNDDVMEYAKRALDLFNRAQRQIDTIGQMVAGRHGYDLKQLTADKSNKEFIDLYLRYAQDNAIESFDAFVLTDGVTLSSEQLKDAENRKLAAQNECLNKLHGLFGKPVEKEAITNTVKSGVKTRSTKVYSKTPAQLDAERERQLKLIKGLK